MAAVHRPLMVVASLVRNGCWGFGSCPLVGSLVVAHWAQLPQGMHNLSSWTRIRTGMPCIVRQILELLKLRKSQSHLLITPYLYFTLFGFQLVGLEVMLTCISGDILLPAGQVILMGRVTF